MKRGILFGLLCGAGVLAAAAGADAARLGLAGAEGPRIIDGAKQRTIEIMGVAEGGNFKELHLLAKWKDTGKIDRSPPLTGQTFRHVFPIGGSHNCGWVSFSAAGTLSGVRFDSETRSHYVDCRAPRMLVGTPVEGQMVGAGGRVLAEVRFEDDALADSAVSGLLGYRLAVDVNGEPAFAPEFSALTPPVLKFNVAIPDRPGRHGIRFTFTDATDKRDEKTVWVHADGTPPELTILSPAADQSVTIPAGGIPSLTVEAEVVDVGDVASGVDRVEFHLDGVGVAVARSAHSANRYRGTFGVPQAGQKTLLVKAFDKVGNMSAASIRVAVTLQGKAAPAGPLPARPRTLPIR